MSSLSTENTFCSQGKVTPQEEAELFIDIFIR